MKKIPRIAALLCSSVFLAGTVSGCGGKGEPAPDVTLPSGYTAVYPEKISGNLHNPGMGWITLEETSWEGKSDLGLSGDLPEVDVIGIQDTWGMIEQTPGVFDFSRIDETIEYWTARGKRINLRICTDSQTLPETHNGCPTWLFEDYGVDYEVSDDLDAVYADLTDSVYQFYFSRFMSKLAEKYAENPYVETVDIRGYGKWGEWHSGHDFADISQRITTLAKIIDTYAQAFANSGKVLFLSATFEFDETMNPNVVATTYEDYYVWQALDYGTTTWDYVSIRRDGGAANLVKYTQDGRFMSDYVRSGKNLPVCGEFASGLDSALSSLYGMDTVESMDDILFTMRPNYCTVLGWLNSEVARDCEIEGNRLLDRGNEKMGYRFAVDSARYPDTVQAGKAFSVVTTLSNSAVGRFWLKGYDLAILLLDGNGREVYRKTTGNFAGHTVMNGEPVNYYTQLSPDLPAGEYTLAYAIVDENGTPSIRMAMGTQAEYESKIYSVGKITVADSVSAPEPIFEKTDAEGLEKYSFQKGNSYSVTFDYTPGIALSDFEYGSSDGYTVTLNGKTEEELLRWQDVSGLKGRKTVIFTASANGGITVGSDGFGAIGVGEVYIERLGGYCEGFDGYDFSRLDAVYYPLDIDLVSVRSGGALSGSHSVELAGASSGFNDLLQIDPSVLELKAGGVYSVSFRAKTVQAGGNGAYFYVMLTDGSDRISVGEWLERDDAGEKRITYTFTVPEASGYTLTFGVKNMGAYLLDDVLFTEFSSARIAQSENHASEINRPTVLENGLGRLEGFEDYPMNGCVMTYGYNRWGSFTSDPAKVISGNVSFTSKLEAFYANHPEGTWFEFMYTNPKVLKLEGMTTYTLEFDYKIVEPIRNPDGVKGYLYLICRSDKLGYSEDKGSVRFGETEELGKVYHMKYTVTTGASDDYYIAMGMHFAGEVIVDNVIVTRED